MKIPILETERLVLRPWREDDVGAYARILRDPEVMRYLGSGVRYRVKRALFSLLAAVSDIEARRGLAQINRHWRRHRFGLWNLEEKQTGALLGNAGLTVLEDWSAEPTNVEMGWLLTRAAWGHGFATEATRASLAYAFENLQLPRVVSVTLAANERSQRLLERLHFSYVGRTLWHRNDVVWYAMDRRDWVPTVGTSPQVHVSTPGSAPDY